MKGGLEEFDAMGLFVRDTGRVFVFFYLFGSFHWWGGVNSLQCIDF